jgi:hypothetical protein
VRICVSSSADFGDFEISVNSEGSCDRSQATFELKLTSSGDSTASIAVRSGCRSFANAFRKSSRCGPRNFSRSGSPDRATLIAGLRPEGGPSPGAAGFTAFSNVFSPFLASGTFKRFATGSIGTCAPAFTNAVTLSRSSEVSSLSGYSMNVSARIGALFPKNQRITIGSME